MKNTNDSLQRTEMRLRQDFLLMLAVDMRQTPESFRISQNAGSPVLSDLRRFVFPEWQNTVEMQVLALAQEMNVGVPNFANLAAQVAA